MKFVNKILLLFAVVAITTQMQAQSENFSIHIIDYSNSFEYDTHYVFDNDELQVYTERKSQPGKKDEIYIHRQLLGKEKEKLNNIYHYLQCSNSIVNIQILHINILEKEIKKNNVFAW